jgi:site-specific recombinase XerD
MATITFFHDKRSGKDEYPLKLRITHKQKAAYISLDIKLTEDQWNGESVINHKHAKALNEFIIAKKMMAESVVFKYGLINNLDKLTANQIKTVIETNGESTQKTNGQNFLRYYEKRQAEQKKKNTYMSYDSAIKRMMLYDPLLNIRTFEDIDETYLRKMDAKWEKDGLTVNSRAVYMRNIRAVFNDALDDQITQAYPFRKFSIKKAPTRKRNLSVDELRTLRDYSILNEFQEKYRDIFMLCFYLRGINMVDLLGLTRKHVRAGRINYVRSKTGKQYSVKIEPEAKVILDRYKGIDYLLDICDGCKDEKDFDTRYKGFLQRMDRGLKKIGPYTRKGLGGKKHIKPLFPDISQYWCRHTTATLMAELGYSNEIIACSLGHEFGIKTTNIYIEYKQSEVDAANRKLIDYVNEK